MPGAGRPRGVDEPIVTGLLDLLDKPLRVHALRIVLAKGREFVGRHMLVGRPEGNAEVALQERGGVVYRERGRYVGHGSPRLLANALALLRGPYGIIAGGGTIRLAGANHNARRHPVSSSVTLGCR